MSEHLRRIRERVGHDLLLIPGVSGLVYDDRGRVLLVYENHGGGWAEPGGAVEPGEAPCDAVVREVWEETGLWVEPIALRGVFGGDPMRVRYPNGDQVEYVTTMFECVVREARCARTASRSATRASSRRARSRPCRSRAGRA